MTRIQADRLARKIIRELKVQNMMTIKVPEDQVLQRATAVLHEDIAREVSLEREVNVMLDDLERKNPGEFQRSKMFTMLKKRLAQEKGIIL